MRVLNVFIVISLTNIRSIVCNADNIMHLPMTLCRDKH